MPIPFTPAWREHRRRRRRVRAVGDALRREPDAADVDWLAAAATDGDVDHARWELRYARAALGLIVAQRDALDDRTAAEIAAELMAGMETDVRIAEDRRALAARQFNERLSAYREAMQMRGGPISPVEAAARALLAFSSDGARTAGAPLAYAVELMGRYADEGATVLREVYGVAALPDDVPPSVAFGAR